MKKFAAILVVIVMIAGWILSVGPFNLGDRISLGLDMIGGVSVVLEAQTDYTGQELKATMEQVQAVMERRVNELGLSEPTLAIENENRIRIELPGAEDAQQAIEVIGRTAQLTFRTADDKVILDGSHVKSASSSVYQGVETQLMGTYTVNLEFDNEGAKAFTQATQDIMDGKIVSNGEFMSNQILIYLDDQLVSDPAVTYVITSSSCLITGRFSSQEAANIAALIRGGSLPVGLEEVQTEIVGPTLGIDAARTSLIAGAIGIALIFIIMVVFYKVMGVVADIALGIYILLVAWIMVMFHAVLTLPGIAGIILSIGMAVDSNVIIFSRIREEIALGKSIRVAVQSGFKRALGTIIDSQVTTVIAAVILFEFGTGSVRGFAMTLLIGIVVSIFTAVVISQMLLNVIAENRKLGTEKNFIARKGKDADKKELPFLDLRKKFMIGAAAIIVLGIAIGLIRGYNLGIDFTGGTMLQLNMGKQVEMSDVQKVLRGHGVEADLQFAGENNEKIIIKTTTVIDNEAREAIYSELRSACGATSAEDNFVDSAGLIGPSVGSELKKNALKACAIAAVAMLVYIAIRFEWRFGIASILALAHDMLMLFALYGIFHIQMNSPFIAGLLIVLGYSINDTIVIFDRIRENLGGPNKRRLEYTVNTSINQCIGRSIMTSLTTIVSIIPLIIMGGTTIREFALPLIAGVLFGTVSSLCLASGFYYDICRLTKKNRYKGA